MITDYKDRSLWNQPIPVLRGKTLYEEFSAVGQSSYDVDTYIAGDYGDELMRHSLSVLNFSDPQDPALDDYWFERGLMRTFHKGADRSHDWVIYVPRSASLPENAGKKYPAFFIQWELDRSLLDMERWGYIDLAAANGLIVIAAQHGRRDDVFCETLDAAIRQYPVDPDRVFLFGHSFTAVCAGLHAVNFADRVAGLCICGSQYYGADSTPEQIARVMELGMPVIFVHSMKQSRCLLPFSVAPEHPMSPVRFDTVITRSPFTLASSYAEQIFWRRINRCRLFDMDSMRDLHLRSEHLCEKKLGVPLEHSYIRNLGGLAHYFGDVHDAQGICRIRMVGVEHGNHFPPAYTAELAWQFLRSFSRDPQTRLTVYDPAPVWPDPTARREPVEQEEFPDFRENLWDVRFQEIGNRSARMILMHHAAPDFDFDAWTKGGNGLRLTEQLRPYLFYGGAAQSALLHRYWKEYGLEREEHDGAFGKWVSYLPENPVGQPVFCLLKNRRHSFSEVDTWGFTKKAAELGAALVIVDDSNNTDSVRGILLETVKLWNCDASRLYLCGHSYTGAVAGRVSLALADLVAGVCILDAQYDGEDTLLEEYERAKALRMPRVDIHGMAMECGLLPYNQDPGVPMPAKYDQNISTSDYAALPSFEEQRFWREINNCPAAGQLDQITGSGKDRDRAFAEMVRDNRARLARVYRLSEESSDPVERALGMVFDRTEIRSIDGVNHFIGDAKDRSGRTVFRTVGVENCPLLPAPRAADFAWEFLSRFSRNANGSLNIEEA